MDTYNCMLELPSDETNYFKQLQDIIQEDVHVYKCSECNAAKRVVATGESAQISVAVKELLTGLDGPTSTSELGTRDLALQ